MKELKLSNSDIPAIVDDDCWDYLSKWPWNVSSSGTIQYSYTKNYKRRHVSLGSAIMGKPFELFDHKDRDPFNNQRNNLRPCTRSQNEANKPKKGGTTSQYKGVYWDSTRQKWQAQICINRNKKALGRFDNEIDAAKAYNIEAAKLYGEFAVLNSI